MWSSLTWEHASSMSSVEIAVPRCPNQKRSCFNQETLTEAQENSTGNKLGHPQLLGHYGTDLPWHLKRNSVLLPVWERFQILQPSSGISKRVAGANTMSTLDLPCFVTIFVAFHLSEAWSLLYSLRLQTCFRILILQSSKMFGLKKWCVKQLIHISSGHVFTAVIEESFHLATKPNSFARI